MKVWVGLCSVAVTVGVIALLWIVAPQELLTWQAIAAQSMTGVGVCVILTDAVFAQVLRVPFTGESSGEKPNIAFTMLKFFTFFPFVTGAALGADLWIEQSWAHFAIAGIAVLVGHWWFRWRYREVVRLNSMQAEVEEGEDEFPMRLGLRY